MAGIAVNQTLQQGYGGQANNSMQSFFDVEKPQIGNVIFYNDHGILPFNVFKTLGMDEELAGMLSQHYEAGWVHPNWHVAANATAGGPGQQLVVQVLASDVTNNTVYTRVTDTIEQANGNFSSVVAKTNPSTGVFLITLNPYDPTVTLSVTAGDTMQIGGNTQQEGTGSPDPRATGSQLFQYPIQIMKECWNGTDMALTNELWFKVDQLGQRRDTYSTGYIDGDYRFVTQIGNTMCFGHPNTNPNNTDSNMYSIDYVAGSTGNTVDYFNGSFGINETKEVLRYANKNGSGGKFFVLDGPEFAMSFNTGASDILAQNPNQMVMDASNTDYTGVFAGGYAETALMEGKEVNITFTKIKWGTTCLYFNEVKQWGLESSYGADGFSQTSNAYLIPMAQCADVEGKMQDRFRMTYKKLNELDLSIKVWLTGGFAPVPTDSIAVKQINFYSTRGTKFYGPQHMQVMTQA